MSDVYLTYAVVSRTGLIYSKTLITEAQRIATNLTQAARQVVLNAVYNNESQVVFSLKLTDETAHGKFFVKVGIKRKARSAEQQLFMA